MRRNRWWGAVLAIFLLSMPLSSAHAQTEEELAQARATFADGVQLLNQENWAEAAVRFRAVMRVRPTPQVKYNLGVALSHLEDEESRSQARHLLREASEDETLDEPTRDSARRRHEELGPGMEAAPTVEAEPVVEPEPTVGRGTLSQPFTGQRPFMLDVYGGVSWFGLGFAGGARFSIPLVHQFVPSINNALYLSVGFDFYYVRRSGVTFYGPGFGIPLALHWEIYFDDAWSAFLELGGQFFVHPSTFQNNRFDAYEPAFFVVAAVGASWRVHENVAITLRVGTPSTSLGATFLF